jgi:hypothetical protein
MGVAHDGRKNLGATSILEFSDPDGVAELTGPSS